MNGGRSRARSGNGRDISSCASRASSSSRCAAKMRFRASMPPIFQADFAASRGPRRGNSAPTSLGLGQRRESRLRKDPTKPAADSASRSRCSASRPRRRSTRSKKRRAAPLTGVCRSERARPGARPSAAGRPGAKAAAGVRSAPRTREATRRDRSNPARGRPLQAPVRPADPGALRRSERAFAGSPEGCPRSHTPASSDRFYRADAGRMTPPRFDLARPTGTCSDPCSGASGPSRAGG